MTRAHLAARAPFEVAGQREDGFARAGIVTFHGRARFEGPNAITHGETSSWYSSRRVGETHSAFKTLVEKPSGRILGAHVLGPRADDVINLFAMAMRSGATASSLREMLFAYPTAGSDIPYMV